MLVLLALEGHPTKVHAFWSACHSDTHHYYLAKPADPFVIGRPEGLAKGLAKGLASSSNHQALSSLGGKAKTTKPVAKKTTSSPTSSGGGGGSAFTGAAAGDRSGTRLVPTPAKGLCFNPRTCPALATELLGPPSSSNQQPLTSSGGGGEKKAAALFTMRKPSQWRLNFAAQPDRDRRWNVRTRPMRSQSVVGTCRDGDVIHATAIEVI